MNHAPELRTVRLRLIASSLEAAAAEINDRDTLESLLNAKIPDDWPPPFNDEDSQRWLYDMLSREPSAVGWFMWYFIRDDGAPRMLVGNGGFKGAPKDGVAEIGYSIVPEFQRRGYGSEAVSALIAWAFSHESVNRIVAETLPELLPSQLLLRKLGFQRCRGTSEPNVLRYELWRGTLSCSR